MLNTNDILSGKEFEIMNKYISGKSVLALSREYNTYARSIKKVLDKHDIKKISRAKRNNPDLIEDYFEEINTPNKAYWLGWILTDGGVTKDHGLEMCLQERDKYILELFQKDLGIKGHVSTFNKCYYKFSFYCKKICKDLERYGVIPNKTLTLKYPPNIPKEYEIDLLRGMFDGDGGLTLGMATRFHKHRNKSYTKPYQELSFSGTYDMCKNFHDKLAQYSDFTKKNIGHNHSIYRVRWSSINEILNIFHVLYANCDEHFLKRKYDLFMDLENRRSTDEICRNN